jgi:hypothetical protein
VYVVGRFLWRPRHSFWCLARSWLQITGRDLELAGGGSTRSSAPVVGDRGGERIFRRRLLIKGLGPGF